VTTESVPEVELATDGEIGVSLHHNVFEENTEFGVLVLTRDFNVAQGHVRNRMRIHSTNDMIWNNSGFGGLTKAYLRDSSTVPIFDNETDLQLVGTTFVKLTPAGAFDGPQNRTGNKRRDLTITGAFLGTAGAAGSTGGMSLRLLQRQTTTSLTPTSHDPAPAPFVIREAPGVTDITVVGGHTAYDRTNSGENEFDAGLFSPAGEAAE
jgi:hypothetical protein